MSRGRITIVSLALLLPALVAPARVRAETCFVAAIDGAQAGTPSGGTGTGHFLLNDDETTLTYKIMVSGLGSAQTGSFIQSDAEGGAQLVSTGTQANVVGVWTSTDAIPLTPTRVADLKAGMLYVSVTSVNYPSGEVRGQILVSPCEEQCFVAPIDGHNTGTPGTGYAWLALNHTETELAYWIEFSGLTSPENAAHIHNNAESGAVVHPLALGSPTAGVWKWTDTPALTGARVKNLKTGRLYVNIHTPNYPAGEISGDIVPGACQPACFAAQLDGAQAGTGSAASGQGYFHLSHARNRLSYDVTTSGIVNETAAHIHSDTEGGGVVRGIGTGASKSGQWDYDDAQPLTLARVQALEAGDLYVNVHTTAYPNGEIRGYLTPIVCGATAVGDTPVRTRLLSNFPNPFNPSTTIAFTLASPAHARIDVYDVRGARVATLMNAPRPAGYNQVTWNGLDTNGRAMASGVYFYRLETGATKETRRMVLLK